MSESALLSAQQAAALLYREAACLDRRKWDEWLGLLTEDVVFWLPAWRNEERQTEDPDKEVSLIYYDGRKFLKERVWRAQSGKSIASVPLARTAHSITNVTVSDSCDSGRVEVQSNWVVHAYSPKKKRQEAYFGYYDHIFRKVGDEWLISRKKITLLNDYIPATLDFYSV